MSNIKSFPLTHDQLKNLAEKFPTPFYIYDEKAIRENLKNFKKAFSIFPAFKEYYAVKACPNPYLLKILREEGCGADCSSMAELILAEKSGMKEKDVMFTSNDTAESEFIYANLRGNIINLDDITHIDFLKNAVGQIPDTICFRYNPGNLKKGGNDIIGKPEEAKYGLTREQLLEAYRICKDEGATEFGLHTMVASNEINIPFFADTAEILFEMAAEIKTKLDISVSFIDLGGGLGIPYKPEADRIDYKVLAETIHDLYEKILVPVGLDNVEICFECGRIITGPYGYLVTKAIHEKHIYREYIGCDACMADLMRPGMYGAYHHMTVSGKENAPCDHVYDVSGSLCENNDKFAVQRNLPKIDMGDLIIIHDAGAHGRAMGFNYNGKLRCGELLLREDGSVKQIRRSETLDDLFATIDFEGLKDFN